MATPNLTAVLFDSEKHQFSIWKIKFRAYATNIGLEAMFEDQDLDNESERQAKLLLILSLDNDTLALLRDVEASTSTALWKQLIQHYERASTASLFHLRSQLMNETLRSNEKVDVTSALQIRVVVELGSCAGCLSGCLNLEFQEDEEC